MSIEISKFSLGFCAFTVDEKNKAYYTPLDCFLLMTHLTIGSSICAFSLYSVDWSSMKNSIIDVGNQVTANYAILVSLASIIFSTVSKDQVWGTVMKFNDIDDIVWHQCLFVGVNMNYWFISLTLQLYSVGHEINFNILKIYFLIMTSGSLLIMIPLIGQMYIIDEPISQILLVFYSTFYFNFSMGALSTAEVNCIVRLRSLHNVLRWVKA